MKHLQNALGVLVGLLLALPAMAGTCGTAGVQYDSHGKLCVNSYAAGGNSGPIVLGLSQCTPTIPTLGATISVPAGTATAVWTTNTATRGLVITYNCSGGVLAAADGSAAWAVSGGYDWNPGGDQVPNKSLTLTCPTAVSVAIAECH